jgi:biopolymer transport protein ExbB
LDIELLSLIKAGGPAMWIIGLCSVAAVAVAVERLMALWRFHEKARALADAVTRALFRGNLEDCRAHCERSDSPAAEVFLAAILASTSVQPQRSAPTVEKVVAAVERERQQVNLKLRQNLWMLGTIGATAPFVGLFGTVVGIMRAFHQMAITGQGGFTVVASGISEALVTTAGGIAVAVEAVVIYNFLNTHVQKLSLQLKLLTEEYLEIVKETLEVGEKAAPTDARAGAARSGAGG